MTVFRKITFGAILTHNRAFSGSNVFKNNTRVMIKCRLYHETRGFAINNIRYFQETVYPYRLLKPSTIRLQNSPLLFLQFLPFGWMIIKQGFLVTSATISWSATRAQRHSENIIWEGSVTTRVQACLAYSIGIFKIV